MAKAAARRPGRPTKYSRAFCDELIKHARMGQSFEAFGAKVGVAKDTLYAWLRRHPEFADARARSMCLLEEFHIVMLQRIATGTARRVSREEPLFDANGKPLIDPRSGRQAVRTEFEPARGNAAAAIFLAKNICGWRDERGVRHSGSVGTEDSDAGEAMSREERAELLERMRADRLACGDD